MCLFIIMCKAARPLVHCQSYALKQMVNYYLAFALIALIHFISERSTSLRTRVIHIDTKFSMNNTVNMNHFLILFFYYL